MNTGTVTVANGFVLETPFRQPTVNIVLVRHDRRTGSNKSLDDRLDRDLTNIVRHTHDHLTATLNHAAVLSMRAGGLSVAAVPRPRAPFSRCDCGAMQGTPRAFRPFFVLIPNDLYDPRRCKPHRIRPCLRVEFVAPGRRCPGEESWSRKIKHRCICVSLISNSPAIWAFDKFNPMK